MILGVSEEAKEKICLLAYVHIIVKKLVLQFWKRKNAPAMKLWVTELMDIPHLQRIQYVTDIHSLLCTNLPQYTLILFLIGREYISPLFCLCLYGNFIFFHLLQCCFTITTLDKKVMRQSYPQSVMRVSLLRQRKYLCEVNRSIDYFRQFYLKSWWQG